MLDVEVSEVVMEEEEEELLLLLVVLVEDRKTGSGNKNKNCKVLNSNSPLS